MLTESTDNDVATSLTPSLPAPGLPNRQDDAATGVSAAGARAIAARALAFYFRAPVKAFFRTRVDYMAFARAVNPRVQANEAWSLHTSTPGLLGHAIRAYGWSFIPKQVAPPLLANVIVGSVLYTSYLQVLSSLRGSAAGSSSRIYPPPTISQTLTAGFAAGTFQSVLACPLDALQVRFRTRDILDGRYKSLWQYAWQKSRSIGLRGLYAGWTLAWTKDALGSAAFFASFEFIKGQAFYWCLSRIYARKHERNAAQTGVDNKSLHSGSALINPPWAMEPSFLFLAGVSAAIAQQAVVYPLNTIQEVHYRRFGWLDKQAQLASRSQNHDTQPSHVMRDRYRHAYYVTFRQCRSMARRAGGWGAWLYQGFFSNTIRQIPSTSAGLIIFELVRRRYAPGGDQLRIGSEGQIEVIPWPANTDHDA